jgi:hypothetical protein
MNRFHGEKTMGKVKRMIENVSCHPGKSEETTLTAFAIFLFFIFFSYH